MDMRNCGSINWGTTNSGYVGRILQFCKTNYYKSGPATEWASDTAFSSLMPMMAATKCKRDLDTSRQRQTIWKHKGEKLGTGTALTIYGWDVSNIKKVPEYAYAAVSTHTAAKAYEESALVYVGASFSRDAVDATVIGDCKGRSYTYTGSKLGLKGIIDTQTDAGGMANLKRYGELTDTDNDGMPDEWEKAPLF